MNVLIVGVGGQGSLLASRILGALFINRGLDVKVSEVHGMSQRGGSVVTYVRAAERVDSPLIPMGEADVIIAFEQLEALRYLTFLKKNGTVVVNTQEINPMPVVSGNAEYPQNILETIKTSGADVLAIDAVLPALEAGSIKAVNVVMLGCASKVLGGADDEWQNALRTVVPERFTQLNLKAFDLGKQAVN